MFFSLERKHFYFKYHLTSFKAYETLTDAQKRQQYDAGGFYHHQQQQQQQNEQGGAHKHAESSKFKFDYNEFYKKFDESFKSFRQVSISKKF